VKSYRVRYEQDDAGWWVATIAAIPGCHTQGRTIEQAEERIREALSLFIADSAAAKAELVSDIQLPAPAKRALHQATTKREQAFALAKESQEATRLAARLLTKQGLSLRDVGKLLGVTRQRAHQLVGG
jgi:predicted RNase H-like HicB family nuclease